MARFTACIAPSSRRPNGGPSFSIRTVIALSAMMNDCFCKPLTEEGSTGIRNKGVCTSEDVTRRTVTVAKSLNRSACTKRAGRGLPKSPGTTTVTRSPRVIPNRPGLPKQRRERPLVRGRSGPLPLRALLAGGIPLRNRAAGCHGPISARDGAPAPEGFPFACAHVPRSTTAWRTPFGCYM